MAGLQVCVFGKLRLQHGEVTLESFPTRRVEELFGYLIINPYTPHAREKLVDTLWPDVSLKNGRASLSTALWRLRTIFDRLGAPAADFLTSDRDWIRFEPPEYMILDWAKFQRYLAKADEIVDTVTRERAFHSAKQIYRGGFCEGIYAEWCLQERERLERRYLYALGQLMAGAIERHAFTEAVNIGREILAKDPLREEVHRAIMHCFWKMGKRSRAVRQFQRCARLLQAELHILPMPETVELYQRIVVERYNELQADDSVSTPYDLELRAAYEAFIAAGDDLGVLLELAEESVQIPEAA